MLEKLSIIVPCFNEEKMIIPFYQELIKNMSKINNIDYEVVFINDGSQDKSLNKIKELIKKDYHIKAITLSRNFGKEAAMFAGLCKAKGDYVVIMDCDLQHPPYLLPQMLKLLREDGYDAVGAFRKGRNKSKNDSFFRVLYSKLFYHIINKMSDIRIKHNATDYRMMKKKVVKALLDLPEYNRFSKGLFEWVGFNTTYIGYDDLKRVKGKSSWSFFKLFNYAIEGITSFSIVPLKLSGLLGLLCALVSFLYMIYVIVDRIINGNEVSGWATIVSLILFLGGITLISLGLLGEYIGRIYNETKKRPVYIIDEIIKHEEVNEND